VFGNFDPLLLGSRSETTFHRNIIARNISVDVMNDVSNSLEISDSIVSSDIQFINTYLTGSLSGTESFLQINSSGLPVLSSVPINKADTLSPVTFTDVGTDVITDVSVVISNYPSGGYSQYIAHNVYRGTTSGNGDILYLSGRLIISNTTAAPTTISKGTVIFHIDNYSTDGIGNYADSYKQYPTVFLLSTSRIYLGLKVRYDKDNDRLDFMAIGNFVMPSLVSYDCYLSCMINIAGEA
jgi:hypothetical protein